MLAWVSLATRGRRSTMEEIRTPSPPTNPKAPEQTPRGADGDIDGLEPALSDVLTPSKEDTPPGTLRKPIKFTYGSSNSLSSLPLPQAAPIDFRASGSSRAVASPPASPAPRELPALSTASEEFAGVLARGEGEEDPFRLSARDLDLREVIGTGAFGRVHWAKWRNTPVAVKVLFHDCSRDDVDMFAAASNFFEASDPRRHAIDDLLSTQVSQGNKTHGAAAPSQHSSVPRLREAGPRRTGFGPRQCINQIVAAPARWRGGVDRVVSSTRLTG